MFADLFSEATRRGLKAVQTQNPGLYYHNAALYALERKQYAQRLCLEAAKVLTLAQAEAVLAPGENSVYFGQRPWRRGLSGECNCQSCSYVYCNVPDKVIYWFIVHIGAIYVYSTCSINFKQRLVVCVIIMFPLYLCADDKPSNMALRQTCIQAMQAQEYRVQHSVSRKGWKGSMSTEDFVPANTHTI